MGFVLFLLVLLLYILAGVAVSLIINLLIEDNVIRTNLDIDKYKFAIVAFWPVVPLVIFVIGLGQCFVFIKDCISEIRKK